MELLLERLALLEQRVAHMEAGQARQERLFDAAVWEAVMRGAERLPLAGAFECERFDACLEAALLDRERWPDGANPEAVAEVLLDELRDLWRGELELAFPDRHHVELFEDD